uniref:Uncharacterized protein n=1 Tax=Chelydra serpentina TaxID=8475 RepID=A0A8C3RUA2_CHESE
MEKEKPFKLFVPPRLSSSQVSAVKPQASARDAGSCQVNMVRMKWLHFGAEIAAVCPVLSIFYRFKFSELWETEGLVRQ